MKISHWFNQSQKKKKKKQSRYKINHLLLRARVRPNHYQERGDGDASRVCSPIGPAQARKHHPRALSPFEQCSQRSWEGIAVSHEWLHPQEYRAPVIIMSRKFKEKTSVEKTRLIETGGWEVYVNKKLKLTNLKLDYSNKFEHDEFLNLFCNKP